MASFYDAFTKRTAENEQAGLRDLQQMGSLMQIQQAMQARQVAAQDEQRNQALMQEIAAIPPEKRNRDTVLPIVLKYAKTPKDLMGALPEAPKAQPIGSGGLKNPDGTITPPAARPEAPPAPTDLARLMAERDAIAKANPADPRLKAYDAAIKTKTEGREPIQVNQFGSPVAGVDDKGNPVFFQPGKAGGQPAIVPGVKPPPSKTDQPRMPGEIQRMNIAMNSLEKGLESYEALLKDFNPRNPLHQFSPVQRAKAESLVADLQLQAKEAQALGALTGPDVEILNRLLRNPASLSGAYFGVGGLKEQLNQSREAIKRRRAGIAQQYPVTPGAPSSDNDPLGIRGR